MNIAMTSLSRMFRRLFSKSTKFNGAASTASTIQALSSSVEEWPEGSLPVSRDTGQKLSRSSDESWGVPGLYETWVELEGRVTKAQSDLQAILDTREKATILRRRAQEVLDVGEAIRAEAQRISEAAWKAFDRGFAVNAGGLPGRWTTVREIDDAMRTYAELQRATHSETWQEADRTRQRATTELLKALTALSTAMGHAERELKEATNLPAVADSLKESAREELRCAQAIRNELLLLGQEALNELDVSPTSIYPGHEVVTISEAQGTTIDPRPEPRQLEPPLPATAADQLLKEMDAAKAPSDAPESPPATEVGEPEVAAAKPPSEVPEAPPATFATAGEPEVATTKPPSEVPEAPPATFAAAGEPEVAAAKRPSEVPEAPPATGAEALEREIAAARPAKESPGSAAATLAQELEKELASIRPVVEDPQPPPPGALTAAQALEKELEALRPLLASTGPSGGQAPAEAAPDVPVRDVADPRPEADQAPTEQVSDQRDTGTREDSPAGGLPTTQEQTVPNAPAKSYTGRLYLMFPSSLSQRRLESVWEVLDQVAGSGNIADTRLISRDAGIQFTLELGDNSLDVEELRRMIPDAQFVALEENRLGIDWPN